MGFIGKMLVMFHAVLSIGMLTWAIGVYTQKINWKSADKEDPGVFDRQQAKAEDLTGAMNRAYYRWTSNYGSVRLFEDQRFPRRSYYTTHLNLVQNGPDTAPAVLQLPIDPATGFLDGPFPPTMRAKLPPRPVSAPSGANAKSIAGYEADIKQTYLDIDASQKENSKALTDRELVNNEVTGVTKPKLIKGLRQQINEQKLIEDEANLEVLYVGGFTTIREAEFGLLKKRRDALTVRMAELKKYIDAKGKLESGR